MVSRERSCLPNKNDPEESDRTNSKHLKGVESLKKLSTEFLGLKEIANKWTVNWAIEIKLFRMWKKAGGKNKNWTW